jgi:hypothetical protein
MGYNNSDEVAHCEIRKIAIMLASGGENMNGGVYNKHQHPC